MCGEEYTIADIAIWPWYGTLIQNKIYDAAQFIQADTYKNLVRWTQEIANRPAVQLGVKVTST